MRVAVAAARPLLHLLGSSKVFRDTLLLPLITSVKLVSTHP